MHWPLFLAITWFHGVAAQDGGQDAMQQAVRLLDDGQAPRAIQVLQEWCATEPDDA